MSTQQTDEPLGAVVHRLSEQIPELVRSEIRLAQAELAEKGKHAGIGIGLFGGGRGCSRSTALAGLLATAVIAARPGAAAVAGRADRDRVLFAGRAASLALRRQKQVAQATPPAPERAIAGVKEDVEAVKGHH